MELGESLEALSTGALQSMSLKDLEAKIHESAVANVSRPEIFDVLMTWFNEQIKQDIITQSNYLLDRFVKLLHMRNYAYIEPFNLTQVDEMFNEWLEKDIIQNPAYRRKYLIIQQDVHHLFAGERRDSQNSGASSLFDCEHELREIHSPSLSCKQEDNSMRAEEDTSLLQDTGHSTHISAAQQYISLARAKTVGIDKSDQSHVVKHMDVILPQQSSDTHSQDAGADNVIIARETIVINSSPDAKMSRKSTRTSRRGRKHKLHSDTPEPSALPNNYICNRCDEPGHWIHYCPTNLDPRYDQSPARDYQCHFCGRKGDHFATLCPKNPYESSLTKQRECAKAETRETRTPTRSGTPYYLDREALAIRSRDRHRSRSPKQRPRDYYRPRSPERYRPRRSGTDVHSPRYRSEGDRHWSRLRDELDVSPYTARVRLTRELHMSSDATEGSEFSSRPWDDPFRSQRRPGSPSPLHYYHSPPPKKARQRQRDLDKATRRPDEGRLAYDDEIDTLRPKTSPCSPATDPSQHILSISEEEVIGPASPLVTVTPEDLDEVKDKTEDFLRALAADIMLKDGDNSRSMVVDTYDVEIGVDCSPSREICIDSSNRSDSSNEAESPAVQTIPGPKQRLVQCPPFSSKIISLFYTRDNPIINARTNRKTASQMMKRSEVFRTPRGKQADEGNTAASLPHRPLSKGVEDGVGAI